MTVFWKSVSQYKRWHWICMILLIEESRIARIDRWLNLMFDRVSYSLCMDFDILLISLLIIATVACRIKSPSTVPSKAFKYNTVSVLWMLTLQRRTIYTLQKITWTLQRWCFFHKDCQPVNHGGNYQCSCWLLGWQETHWLPKSI